MLQVAAGATSICGASIGPRQYADAKRRLRLWSKTEDAWTCLWQSARYLRQSLWADWGVYSTWAVFLTTVSRPHAIPTEPFLLLLATTLPDPLSAVY